jgi:gliding motility-associated-like protein
MSGITVYTVTGTSGGCSSLDISTVTITPNPAITATSGAICVGGTATLTASGANTYTWALSGTLSSTTGGTVTATPTITTTYTISGTNSVSCTNTTITTVTVIPVTTITVTPNTNTICVGGTTTLTATGATTYTWSPATGLSSTSNSVVVANPTVTTPYVVLGSAGTCSAIPTTATVIVSSPPTITIAAFPTICPGNSTTLTATGTATSYSWSANAGGVTSNSVVVTPLSTTSYTVTGNLNNCTLPKTTTVNVYTISPLFITPSSTTICSDSSITLSTTSGLQVYTWYPTSSSTSSTNIVHPAATTVYSVTGQDAFGCHYDTATATITVIPCITYTILIPNVFSPNGDNINDNFDVTATGITSLTCDIYDRWGLKLYSYNTVNGYWDGTNKGAKEPDGTYFYVILTTDIKGDNHKYNGFIQLIR